MLQNFLKRCFIIFSFSSCYLSGTILAQDLILVEDKPDSMSYNISGDRQITYYRPNRPWLALTNIPGDYADYLKQTIKKERLIRGCAVVGSTALLIWGDQAIIDNTQSFLTKVGLDGEKDTHYEQVMGGTILFPRNLNGIFYYLGDGTPHVVNNIAFYILGGIKKDYRLKSTALQLTEGLIGIGIGTQLLKHITGRESPYISSQPGGKWRFFPNQRDYMKNVSKYDAYPSGHLATTMIVTTILAGNFPEYRFIRPLGYACSALLSIAMLNNGVHWASDYPLSIGMGYAIGKIIVSKWQKVTENGSEANLINPKHINWSFSAIPTNTGVYPGISLSYSL